MSAKQVCSFQTNSLTEHSKTLWTGNRFGERDREVGRERVVYHEWRGIWRMGRGFLGPTHPSRRASPLRLHFLRRLSTPKPFSATPSRAAWTAASCGGFFSLRPRDQLLASTRALSEDLPLRFFSSLLKRDWQMRLFADFASPVRQWQKARNWKVKG